MATTVSPITPPRSRALIARLLVYGLLLLLCAAGGVLIYLYSVARSALPQLDGTLHVSGISAPVSVIRDGHGAPTIDAANLDDLFFAQGYVTAQERIWQMDIARRFAAGDLSEIVGDVALEHDRQQRILGLRAAARKAITNSLAAEIAPFEAYSRGVNAFIESHRNRLPIEFRILRYSPRSWTTEDSLLIGEQMVENLSTSPRHALIREKILGKLGPELTADLYVNSSWHDRPPTVARPTLQEHPADADGEDNDQEEEDDPGASRSMTRGYPPDATPVTFSPSDFFPRWFDDASSADPPPVLGSNNWVVSGAHTVTGKPLLSNDMHLGHQMPNLWFEAHLRSGDLDVAGVTLPGVPYVIVGHNQRIAWGFTNLGPTVEDAYLETFNAGGQYLTPDGWKEPEHRQEIIHVKGKPDVALDVVLTRHGPITTDLIPGETRKIALRWTLYDGIHNPFLEIDRARNWDEFRKALSGFDAPGQNAVYADIDGNIGYQATGKVPIRASGDGSLPENGSDNAHEWTGYIPFDKLPSVYNPPWGIIATANSRVTPDGYPNSISVEWEAPWRSARIYRVLESGKKLSAADMLALQTDIYSDAERFLAEHFVYAADHAKNPSARMRQAADLLRQWDGRMTADSPAPTIETRARSELMRLLLEPKIGPSNAEGSGATLSWKSYSWMSQSVWLENVLLHQPQRWLPKNYPDYNELLAAAIDAAVNTPDAPKALESWRWGGFNPVEIQHFILGRIPILRHWAEPGVQSQSGSGYTVKRGNRKEGPSERITVDLSNFDQSTLNLVTGESGNFLSPYYMDQWRAWYQGFTFPWPFSQEAVKRTGVHRLVLQP
jgi:penicillin amidase